MNSLKKGEGFPLLNFEGVPGPFSHFYTMPKDISLLKKGWCEKSELRFDFFQISI